MKKDMEFYWKMFISTFTVSAFTFGGGFVIIPLLRSKFVNELGWIEENEMMDLAAIAQSTPGPVAINCSVLIGYRLSGIPGACLTLFATVLPPLIIITLISYAYEAFRSNVIVRFALQGMQAGIAAVIADVVYGMALNVFKLKKALPIAIMFAAFLATYFMKINVVIIILTCGAIGLITTLMKREKGEK